MGGRGGRIFQESGRSSALPIFEDDRRIQQPDNYNIKFLSELGLAEHLSAKARASIKLHEKSHFLDHSEQGAIFDTNGKQIYYTKGKQTQVSLPTHLCKGNIITHNHPATIPIPSPQDIKTFIEAESYEERVTGLSGQVVRLWHNDYDKRDKTRLESFVREYERVFNQAQKYAFENHMKRRFAEEVNDDSRYQGMTTHYCDNFPDYIKDQVEYLEKHFDFSKYGIQYSRTKEF